MCLSSTPAPENHGCCSGPRGDTNTNCHPSPAGRPPEPQPRALLRAGTKLRELQGHGHGTGGRRERAANSAGAPRSSQEGLGTYRDSRPPRPATAAALSGASGPSRAPCAGAARAALWDERRVRAEQRAPAPSVPRPGPPPAPPAPRPRAPCMMSRNWRKSRLRPER